MRTSTKPKASIFGRILLVMSLLVFGMAGLVAPASAGGGYPDDDATDCSKQFGIYSWCKNGTDLSGRGYGYRNCTDWVAYRLESQGITNHVRGRGNGKQWDDSSTGVTLTTTPEVGDAAVWNNGTYGHVAYVEETRLKAGGGYEARVSEYNQAGTGMYTDTRWVVADKYVDFNGVGTPVGGSQSPGVSTSQRVVVRNANGDLWVKEGAIGAGWTLVTQNVVSYAVSPNRIAVYDGAHLSVKEGALNAGWVTVTGQVDSFAVTDNRIAVMVGGQLSVKDGPIGAVWTLVGGGTSFKMSPNRIALYSNGQLLVKEGPIKVQSTNTEQA